MIGGHYILNDKREAVLEPDATKFSRWFEKADRTVLRDTCGGVLVSTVFLGVDHGFGTGKPVLFETMIFGGPLADSQWRYHTWDEAVCGHVMALAKALQAEQTTKEGPR